MLYDIIKLLNLEDYNIDISSAYVIKENNIFYLHLKLKKLLEYTCKHCGCICSTTHDYVKKKIKHGLFLNNELVIIYYARRIKCNDCGKSFFEHNPFSNKFDSISYYTKFKVLDSLRDFHSTYTSVAKLYHLSKNQVMNIFDEHVDCSPKQITSAMNFDEFYRGKKSKQKYAFVITNHLTGEIIDILPSRKKEYLTRYFDSIPRTIRNNVKFICIDMYETYKDIATLRFPKALIAVDSFHVIQHINQALIELRVFVMNKFDKRKSKLIHNDMYYYMLKKFHYFFVKDYDKIYDGYINIPKMKTNWKKDQILNYLLSIDENLSKAYYLKEQYRELNKLCEHTDQTKNLLFQLITKFINFGFTPIHEVGKMMLRWENEIFNSFIKVDGKRLSNGTIEGVNSRIKTIIKNGCGYISFRRLRNKIMFSLNKNEPIRMTPIKKKIK